MDDSDIYLVNDGRNAVVAAPQYPMLRPAPRPGFRPWPAAATSRPFLPSPYQSQRPIVIVQRPLNPLAGIDYSELLERGVAVLAAWQPPPDAPSVTGDPCKDVANMILYQESLTGHAKADERVRAFGGIAAQVVKVLLRNAQQQRSALGNLGFSLGA